MTKKKKGLKRILTSLVVTMVLSITFASGVYATAAFGDWIGRADYNSLVTILNDIDVIGKNLKSNLKKEQEKTAGLEATNEELQIAKNNADDATVIANQATVDATKAAADAAAIATKAAADAAVIATKAAGDAALIVKGTSDSQIKALEDEKTALENNLAISTNTNTKNEDHLVQAASDMKSTHNQASLILTELKK